MRRSGLERLEQLIMSQRYSCENKEHIHNYLVKAITSNALTKSDSQINLLNNLLSGTFHILIDFKYFSRCELSKRKIASHINCASSLKHEVRFIVLQALRMQVYVQICG